MGESAGETKARARWKVFRARAKLTLCAPGTERGDKGRRRRPDQPESERPGALRPRNGPGCGGATSRAPAPRPHTGRARTTRRCTSKCGRQPSSRRRGSAARAARRARALLKARRQIFEAYCSKKSVARDHVRFLFDGQRINPDSTPSEARGRGARARRLFPHPPPCRAAGNGGWRQHRRNGACGGPLRPCCERARGRAAPLASHALLFSLHPDGAGGRRCIGGRAGSGGNNGRHATRHGRVVEKHSDSKPRARPASARLRVASFTAHRSRIIHPSFFKSSSLSFQLFASGARPPPACARGRMRAPSCPIRRLRFGRAWRR